MTTGEMLTWTNRFKGIINSSAPQYLKDSRLAFMMDDLEMAHSIPILASSPRMDRVNPFALQMYRTVSDARSN